MGCARGRPRWRGMTANASWYRCESIELLLCLDATVKHQRLSGVSTFWLAVHEARRSRA
jgi:hypothetical protein